MAGATQPLPITKGKVTKVYGALLGSGDRAQPANVAVTTTALAAKGATALTITDIATGLGTSTIRAGQYLGFVDADDKLYIAQVTADYTAGVSLTVAALPEAIPSGAEAVWPTPFKLRTDSAINFSTDVQDVNTYDHSVNGDASPGASTVEITLSGEYSPYDPGYLTAAYAQRNSLEMWVIRELGNPNASSFTKGKVTAGAALITSREEPAPNDGNVSANVTARFVGDVIEADPVPTV